MDIPAIRIAKNRTSKVLRLALALVLTSFISSAQTLSSADPALQLSREQDLLNSRPLNPIYVGYHLGLGATVVKMHSDLAALNGLRVPFLGVNVGGVVSNSMGKLRTYAGWYYPDSSVPQDFDLLEAGLSANLYLLRLKKYSYHTLEPYILADLNFQLTRYYGSYLPNSEPVIGIDQPLLGNTFNTQVRLGTGLEFQLENVEDRFIHLFAEGGVGIPFYTTSSNSSFANTRSGNQLWLTVGIDFGIVK